jgi:hypothetical protein
MAFNSAGETVDLIAGAPGVFVGLAPLIPSTVSELGKIRGRIFSHVRPFYERDVSNLDP